MLNKWIAITSLLITQSGCVNMLSQLRADLHEPKAYSGPTIGGNWTEKGMLGDEVPGDIYREPPSDLRSVARNGRSLASENGGESKSFQDPDISSVYNGTHGTQSGSDQRVSYADSPNVPPSGRFNYGATGRATKRDFIDSSQNEGSLWASDGQTNYYFTKNKIRGVGDLVMITLDDPMVTDINTEIARTLNPKEREEELALAQARIRALYLGLEEPANGKTPLPSKDAIKTSQAAPAKAGAIKGKEIPKEATLLDDENAIKIPKATWADVDVGKSVELKANDQIMAEIVERFPNGNYKIRGTKKVRYRNGHRFMTILGVVRGTDISEEDVVPAAKMYEYRLEVIR